MEQDNSLSWPDITAPGDDEFSNFLEFGMHFPDMEGHGPSDQHPPRSVAHSVSMPTSTTPSGQEQLMRMETDAVAPQSSSYDRMMGDFSIELSNQVHQSQSHGSIPASFSDAPLTPAFYAQKPPHSQIFNHQQLQQPPEQSHHQHVHHSQPTSQPYVPHGQPVIPPTPNSIEMQGSAATYPQRVDENHEMYDRYARINEEQALYTPLVSPAMTPLETQFRLPEYTIPGEYFTPLTSPALEAQNANSTSYPFHSGHVSDMGFVNSPIDNSIPVSSAKKQQSPSVRPQTRKKSLLQINSDEILNGLSQHQGGPRSQPSTGSGLRYGSNESSGQDSVSPEPLSEPLMPPPALPPARRSPAIAPQMVQSQTNEPATPAMLMRIQRPQHSPAATGQASGPVSSEPHDDIMEEVILPEAATPTTHFSQSQVTRIDTSLRNVRTDAASPATSAGLTPALEPKSTPLAERNPSSVAPSPRTVAMPSPSGPIGKKSDTPKLGPLGRKRQSLSSSQPSPNLRPKISPSIQPLVRGECISSETSALYLASKSNYQHILDGTLLPGVSYPEALAENLSSKRTNHKLAEQGRRNRINNALKEIEALIPAGEKEKEKPSNQQISKASTVEMAIDYIKALKKELEETKGKLKAAEARLGEKETSQTHDVDSVGPENEQLEKPGEVVGVPTSPVPNGPAESYD
ncbi:putative HLH transcription factor (PalcA) [Aspergillus nomiae NRRL 13137]|uniref:Putative HLH transcription factor (PalcA) n=1 Tax=Aspergillus nomiae NRRL (strain ATCC 15546 / NRRL 13137 / CBS 260.88 / M93) TaxID=1509407 RepID=A0A0L1IS00_ASPN3|nr:putative HLH transcription factor (PalcA) [Aspergillus nomiae NRRL 13137]KNG82160.1 putative HLH transcription factor (PalcA) [Aspergillus nomiae NRRL 13137]